MPDPRKPEQETPNLFGDLPSNLDYKEQGFTFQEIESRRIVEPPSNIDFKDQGLSLQELQRRRRQQHQRQTYENA